MITDEQLEWLRHISEDPVIFNQNETTLVAIRALLAERKQLRETLAHYADPENWGNLHYGDQRVWCGPTIDTPDGFGIAREALAIPSSL